MVGILVLFRKRSCSAKIQEVIFYILFMNIKLVGRPLRVGLCIPIFRKNSERISISIPDANIQRSDFNELGSIWFHN